MHADSETVIRKIEYEDLDAAFQLIKNVFQEFVAPDYPQEGIESFYNYFTPESSYRRKLASGKETMYGAYAGDTLAGVLSLSAGGTVSCVFVDGKYHRQGIGSGLFCTVIRELKARGESELHLSASPYAVPFYHALGFRDTGEQSSYKGIVYTPMKLTF
ncbi:GNAT family N-acetyltransferase [Lachnotalea sp. AF33-28]|jgi:GNAT superfamily N-acetyltransferase|uniref:GNAT family N-acetyltransferase n=1 Tax=Lachnotalea sp. AF33-28 TaxID=2292046 RepID=UPI000E47C3BD|nr:GNAT family N-acetyltransferase [Lachnotalea sp. AF33-28]RHP33957.1 GNAT family N-acetyltransferase [Lachnotalea sp. AF33-28]